MSDIKAHDRPVNLGNPQMGWASDVAAEMLRQLGIKYISLNPGASYRGLHDSIVNYLGNDTPQMLICLHEDHAVHVAQGYAKATGEPMGCALHSNVGLMHGLMAIFNAWCYRAPMIMMGATGPVDAPLRRPWIDWIHTAKDQGAMLRNYTKWDDEPRSAEAIVETMLRANQMARSEPPGPVYVCLDAGLQEQALEEEITIPDVSRFQTSDPPQASSSAVKEVADMLLGASDPVIMIGRSARTQEAWDNRVKLAEAVGAGVVTNLRNAAVFPSDHLLHVGRPAGRINDTIRNAVLGADAVLSLNWLDFGGTQRLLNRDGGIKGSIVHCSMEPYVHNGWGMELFELPMADVKIEADHDALVTQLLEEINSRGVDAKWDGKRAGPEPEAYDKIADRDADSVLQPADIVTALAEAQGDRKISLNRVSSGGVGPAYHFTHPLSYLGHDGGGGLASGPGTSVGAALAVMDSDWLPVSVLGDGDFMQGNTALWTAAKYKIPMLVIISNNRSNFNDELHQETVAKDRDRPVENRWIGMRISEPDIELEELACSLGFEAQGPITTAGELMEAMENGLKAVEAGGQHLINVHVDTGYAEPPLMRGGSKGE
ncbi:MAG: acetolactate synthase [Rhodospirillaceae bacterium]|nr:acetolactate synthase [Rhodospirillaceae bacterium]|tara:strand:- start:6523 stop:8322 length:1800 start_codon:yes stop_codon:yes gene_type:complete